MPVESKLAKKVRAEEINRRLTLEYPDAACALIHKNAFELLVATMLSAQCTDKRVNLVTPSFFKRWPDAQSLSEANIDDIAEMIRSTGFFNTKSKNLLGMATAIVNDHGRIVPDKMELLVRLPGVGRKTANVILGNVYGVPGLVVDTHMIRLSNLLGLARGKDAVKIEHALMTLLPTREWTIFSHRIIDHGRAICIARRPQCSECSIAEWCPSKQ